MEITMSNQWIEVGRGIEKLQSGARAVSLHSPPGDKAPWLSEEERFRWRVNFSVGNDHFGAGGGTPLEAVRDALGLLKNCTEE